MDVAFVIDATGSMGGAINNVKAAIPQLMDQVVAASGGDYRAAWAFPRRQTHGVVRGGNRSPSGCGLGPTAFEEATAQMPDEALRTTINALGPGPHQTGTALPFRSRR
jgi:hypothetical protein